MRRYMMLLAMLLLGTTLAGCIVAPYDWDDGYYGHRDDGWHHGHHHGGHRGYYGEGYHRY